MKAIDEPVEDASCASVKEFPECVKFCHGCFSTDRDLSPLDKNLASLIGLEGRNWRNILSDVPLCQECSTILKKMKSLQQQIQISLDMQQRSNGQDLAPSSALSKVCNPDVPKSVLHTSADTTGSYKDCIIFKEEEEKEGKEPEVEEEDIDMKCENDYDDLIDLEEPRLDSLVPDSSVKDGTDKTKKGRKRQQETEEHQLDSKLNVDVRVRRKQPKLDAENQTTLEESNKDLAAKHIGDAALEEQELTLKDTNIDLRTYGKPQHKAMSKSSGLLNSSMDSTTNVEKESTETSHFECDMCLFVTSDKNSLIKHIKTHDDTLIHTKLSTSGLHSAVDNLDHSRIHSRDENECEVCDKRFKKLSGLKKHMTQIHTGGKPFKCNMCDKKYIDSDKLNKHLQIHTKPFKCEVCDEKFAAAVQLERHAQTHAGFLPFKCLECDKRFSQAPVLKKHALTHTGHKPFQCEECGKTFTLIASLTKHAVIHTGNKPFKCEKCGQGFNQAVSLRRHTVSLHTGDSPFKCEVCDKKFALASQLKCHAATHTDHRPFKCEECDKSFFRSSQLKRHADFHTGHRPFKCKECDKSYFQKMHLQRHADTHTGHKPFKCEECEKTFSRSDHLKNHAETHTAAKPFKCKECGERFRRASHLKCHLKNHLKCHLKNLLKTHTGHLKTHTGHKPFKCKECGERFRLAYHLKKHAVTHRVV